MLSGKKCSDIAVMLDVSEKTIFGRVTWLRERFKCTFPDLWFEGMNTCAALLKMIVAFTESHATLETLYEMVPSAKPPQHRITLRLDEEVIFWFKNRVKGTTDQSYQHLINRVRRRCIKLDEISIAEGLGLSD